MELYTEDTIAAIATAPGESGIGIVRVSGKQALEIAGKIFLPANGRRLARFPGYTMHYGWIVREDMPAGGSAAGGIIDEVLLTVMRAPRSYTREDVIEINCHGGIVAQRAVLERILEKGCRLAQPGEFTRRAFLNGRIDLSQAEAVLDIIKAKTDSALSMGMEHLRGAFSQEVRKIRKRLIKVLAGVEANIDFPEEESGALQRGEISGALRSVHSRLREIIAASSRARIFREGIRVVICGKPNVGKSSLLNAILRQERSIVTPVAGTTRDTIEEIVDMRGIPVKIVDTAGIVESRDPVEKKAVQRARQHIDAADAVMLVFDASRELSSEDAALMRKLKHKKTIPVLNKTDLPRRLKTETVAARFGAPVEVSAKKLGNIAGLEDAIIGCVYKGNLSPGASVQMCNARHIFAVKRADSLIAGALHALGKTVSLEFIAQDIKEAVGHLDGILGERFSEDLLDRIFSDFCIGK